jgi:hypothetical protein
MVTGKNKEQFKKWCKKLYVENLHFRNIWDVIGLENLPFEMQIGVYLAYYDSLGIYITCNENSNGDVWYCAFVIDNHLEVGYDKESRKEAYIEAFKNELINKNKDEN